MADSADKVPLLGDFQFTLKQFKGLDSLFATFKEEEFLAANIEEKRARVGRALLQQIKDEPKGFLLGAVVDYIARVEREKVLENYTFSSFELWLNQISGLSIEENYQIRAKIVGKFVPRDAYQIYFPIGMDKYYVGTHFVTAHNSPDLDTTVASFWGWVDAFAAQISHGLHIWNVPGGAPSTQVEIGLLFYSLFGEEVFAVLAKTRLSLTLTSLDLLTQVGMTKKKIQEPALSFDQERQRSAVVLVDDEGYYLGDWRTIDVEGVRQIILALNNCLLWLESTLHIRLISCFAQDKVTAAHISAVIREILQIQIRECHPAKELPPKQASFVHEYMKKVLQIEEGLDATFESFALAMEKFAIVNFTKIIDWLKSLIASDLFSSSGLLTENRPRIFNQLETLVKALSESFVNIRQYVDRLEVAFKIKTEVFGFAPQSLSYRTDIDEIRSKIKAYSYLTVTDIDREEKKIPIGVVHSSDLQQGVLGTVTLRDFCNREEMKIPSYLEIISVIDHHKSSLLTTTPPKAIIGDAQAANVLVADLAFSLNDRYSLGGMSQAEVEEQLEKHKENLSTPQSIRLYQHLLQRKKILQKKEPYWIDPQREFGEYLHFIYAILDDTDLLTKVSRFDVECVAKLLNRMKSIILGKETEVVHFDDIAEDKSFTEKAANRLLTNEDFYSLYSKVYRHKEQSVEENLQLCVEGEESTVFSDVKTLNSCNRVSQTKLFACNYAHFKELSSKLRAIWYQQATNMYDNNEEILLYLHMVSTIASADELFQGKSTKYTHTDELWIWIPETELAIGKLKLFLNAFKASPQIQECEVSVEFLGDNREELDRIFTESFLPVPKRSVREEESLPIAVLHFDAGKLNSRKGMIAPFLPQLDQ